MGTLNLDAMTTQFYNAGLNYSAAIQPYALKLFFALFLIDIIVTWIQYTAEGQADPSFFLGRMLKHVLSGGFVYLMIVNGFSWMYLVIQSFGRIGAAISGLPALSPQSVLAAGLNMASTLLESPASSGVMSTIEEALTEWFCAVVVGAAFVIVAAELLVTLVKSYLITGLGVILLGFGGNRFTASAAEGYFTSVIRIGTKLLFFYAVLAIGMNLVAQWQADLAAACKPATVAVPLISSYYMPPSKIMTTICSGSISASNMLAYAAFAALFATVTVAVPSMAAELVGGTVGLALAHAFEAAYVAQTIVRPITSGLGAIKKSVEALAGSKGGKASPAQSEEAAMQTILRQQWRQTSANQTASTATTVLNPFTGEPRPYNGPESAAAGPLLPPPPNNGPGGGGAQLGYVPGVPGRPGQHTKDIAVDVTELQHGNGQDGA